MSPHRIHTPDHCQSTGSPAQAAPASDDRVPAAQTSASQLYSMMQQMLMPNRFISLADDDPDDSDVASAPSLGKSAAKPIDDASADSDATEYLSVEDEGYDNPYFQQGSDQLPRELWTVAAPLDFRNQHEVLRNRQTIVELFHARKEIETPLGMDDTQQMWRWADVGARHMPCTALTYPTLEVEGVNGKLHPVFSQVDRHSLFHWITEHLSWLPQFDTVYVFVDNRALAGADPPDYWPWLAPWMQARCNVIGPHGEKTTAIHFPITAETGLNQVHYTWAGAPVLEALCLVHPTVNFALSDSDCVPTSLFEVAELVLLMTDEETRKQATQHQTMANSPCSPPAVLLMTEARAELNAGLIIVTSHTPPKPTTSIWNLTIWKKAAKPHKQKARRRARPGHTRADELPPPLSKEHRKNG